MFAFFRPTKSTRKANPLRTPLFRPQVEQLEDRLTPSAIQAISVADPTMGGPSGCGCGCRRPPENQAYCVFTVVLDPEDGRYFHHGFGAMLDHPEFGIHAGAFKCDCPDPIPGVKYIEDLGHGGYECFGYLMGLLSGPAMADLIAYRPVNDYFYYPSYPIVDSQEESYTLGPGIRINGDDDNHNDVPDYSDSGAAAADNDLIRVDVAASGTAVQLAFTGNLKVWTTGSKAQEIPNGASVAAGTVYVEYVSPNHTTGATSAVLTLTASAGTSSATDRVVFHSFQSVVIAIGGFTQDPANVGDPNLGVFTIAANLYGQGYDVQMYKESQVRKNGTGAAYDEVVSAVTKRNVDFVAIYGYSYGGGATYELAKGLKANTLVRGQYNLAYTAYIDAIKHRRVSSEGHLPPGTQYHDNIYQRLDPLLKGKKLRGANYNLDVSPTTWGFGLIHTTIDDNAMVQDIIITNLTGHVVR